MTNQIQSLPPGFTLSMSWQDSVVSDDLTLADAIKVLDKTESKICLVINQESKLIGTITDGDIRRAILKNVSFDATLSFVMNEQPLTFIKGEKNLDRLGLISEKQIKQVPVVNNDNRIVDLLIFNEGSARSIRRNHILIMAGGKGSRLAPITNFTPKPMLLVKGRPILEHIVSKARGEGFQKVLISVGHLGDVIENYFTDGSKFGVEIEYIREESAMGTAGALTMLDRSILDPLVITNGDLISNASFSGILDFHNLNSADATMAVKIHEIQNPFGVVVVEGDLIKEINEKPMVRSTVNAGIYCISPEDLLNLPRNIHLEMTELFQILISRNKRIAAYPLFENWEDIGRPADYERVNNAID